MGICFGNQQFQKLLFRELLSKLRLGVVIFLQNATESRVHRAITVFFTYSVMSSVTPHRKSCLSHKHFLWFLFFFLDQINLTQAPSLPAKTINIGGEENKTKARYWKIGTHWNGISEIKVLFLYLLVLLAAHTSLHKVINKRNVCATWRCAMQTAVSTTIPTKGSLGARIR